MKTIDIWALIFLIIGIVLLAISLFWESLSSGYLAIWAAYPLIIIGAILFIISLSIQSKK
jgi:hypothetical protein